MTARRRSLAERLYRWLLRLLPNEFRSDFAESMARDVADRADELPDQTRARLWSRELPALVRTALLQHLDDLSRDVTFALRMMARSPGFTAAAILMLAIGTGANAAMFSVIDAVMLRSALEDPARIVAVLEQSPGQWPTREIPVPDFAALRDAPAFTAIAGITGALPVWIGAGEPRRLDTECVSASMFRVLGVQALIGRTFGADDDRAGAPPVIVLSHQAWQRDFGGAPDVVGRTVTLDGSVNTVIGVMPAAFLGPYVNYRVEGWAPFAPALAHQRAAGCDVRFGTINLIARVRAPRTLDSASGEINGMGLLAHAPLADGSPDRQIQLVRADSFTYDGIRTPFFALLGAVGCVLLIACANVTNLQLERLVGRRREIAVRLVLGASRGRVVRQTLTENLLVSVMGAAAGLLTARLTLSALVGLMPRTVPHVQDIAIGPRTLAATLGAAIVVGLIVGILPAMQATADRMANDLKASARGATGGARWLRRSLVIAEVALSVVLLVGAALMVRTFLVLRPVHPGFDPSGRVIVQLSLPGTWTRDASRQLFLDDTLARVGAIPGVASVSASSYMPLSGVTSFLRITVDATPADVWTSWVTAHYFRDMEMSIERGRIFNESDTRGSQPVMLINETAAQRFWPGRNPIGQIIQVKAPDGTVTGRQVVGILHDTRSWGNDTEHRSELYVPYAQEPGPTLLYLIVRMTGAANPRLPAQIRAAVSAARPGQVVDAIDPLQDRLDRSVSRPRFGAWLFSIFAVMAVGLAALGLAAVIAWWVAQRRREIGVRMALGASRWQVTTLVVKQGLALAVLGTIIGVGVAAFSARLLESWLYGVQSTDAQTYVACAVAMIAIAALSSYVPARRATKIDPIVTLRAE